MYVCEFVSYRFSRQPLTRLFWNFAWCFEIMSERQLSILVSIGCIITELWHNKGVWGGLEVIRKWNFIRQCNDFTWCNIWRQIYQRHSWRQTQTLWGQSRRIDDGWRGKGAKRRVTGDERIVTGIGWRTMGEEWQATGDWWWTTDVKQSRQAW